MRELTECNVCENQSNKDEGKEYSKMGLQAMLNAVSAGMGPPRLVEIGKIKVGGLGEKRVSARGKEWRMPRKDDHFTVTGLTRNKDGDLIPDAALMQSLIKQYGDKDGKLRQIPIRLLTDDIDRVLVARFAWYGHRSCAAYSDGETVTWLRDPNSKDEQGQNTYEVFDPPRVDDWRPDMLDLRDRNGAPLFKLHLNFSCTIHSADGRWGGVYVFRSTSVISFRQLYASLLDISEKTGGVLVGMPLWLVVRPMLVTPDGKPTNVYVVHVEVRGKDLQELQRMALEQAEFRLKFQDNIRRIQAQYQRLLVAPGDESAEDAEFIAEEFAPAEPDEIYRQGDEPDATELLTGDVGQRNGRGTAVEQPPEVTPTPAEETKAPDED